MRLVFFTLPGLIVRFNWRFPIGTHRSSASHACNRAADHFIVQPCPHAVGVAVSYTHLFYNLDASHGYQLYKLLHDARVRRRKCKNAIAWIDFILEQRPERFVENDPSARIVGTRSRDYAPRALPELFEWENEGQTSISVS